MAYGTLELKGLDCWERLIYVSQTAQYDQILLGFDLSLSWILVFFVGGLMCDFLWSLNISLNI